jgi:gamma-glutamyl-gamma-aminobutyrate hydrolase PuuD
MKVYVVGEQRGYARWIDNCKLVDNIHAANVVLFTGGGDISPKYYNCEQHPTTWPSPWRDVEEIEVFQQIRSNQVCFGICRGFQLQCVMYGGLLIQDVTNHAGCDHTITDGKEVFLTTSLHHQMIYPWNLDQKDYDILYWSSDKRSKHYFGDKINSEKIIIEPEMAVFHRENMPICLGVQGHPEMMPLNDPFVRKINQILLSYVESVQNTA